MAVTLHKDTATGDAKQTDGTLGAMHVNVQQAIYSTTTTSKVTVGTTGTVLVAANPDRKFLSVSLGCGLTEECVAVRYYPAATDDLFQPVEILQRQFMGVANVVNTFHLMQQTNIYTGEVSAVTDSGSSDVYVTEGF
jgi:hypothetical protein